MADLGGNPFAQLFPSLSAAEEYTSVQSVHKRSKPNDSDNIELSQPSKTDPLSLVDDKLEELQRVNAAIQECFLITLNKFSVLAGDCQHLVYLSQLAESIGTQNQSWLDLSTLEQALFERLMLEDVADHVITDDSNKNNNPPSYVIENRLVVYLYSCYVRCNSKLTTSSTPQYLLQAVHSMQDMIVQNLVTAFIEPELYFNQNLQEDLEEIILRSQETEPQLVQLLNKFAFKLKEEENGSVTRLTSIVQPILEKISSSISETSIILLSTHTVKPLAYFIKGKELAEIFIRFNTPQPKQTNLGNVNVNGKSYEETLIGKLLSKSSIPVSDLGPAEFFDDPTRSPASVHARTEAQIWSGLESVHSAAHYLFNALFRVDEEVKHLTLEWIGNCLLANTDRGKLWTSQVGGMLSPHLSSDGFMLNLGSVLLRFCAPFTDNTNKMDRIDPRYCSSAGKTEHPIHLKQIEKETCLVTLPEGEERPTCSTAFNFPTEIFFITHRCLDLGFRVVQEKFNKLNQELSRLESAYTDAQENGGGAAAEDIHKRMNRMTSTFLSIKAALLEPATLEKQTSLVAATCTWLVKLVTGSKCPPSVEQMTTVPEELSCIPDFTIVNLCEHILLIRRFNPGMFEQFGERLPEIFCLILVMMGKPIWLKNPHLRARLAEVLECLLPNHQNQAHVPNILGNYQRQALFQDHESRLQLVESILHVFVSIEETGQSVEFEQKFSYRRPMYDVIKYIWTLDEYKVKFRTMADQAERDIECESPPLFLRFINLLINDAIFLLDEGLNYMRTLQEQESARASWADLPQRERMDNERQYAHSGQLARFHNVMASETIAVLELMTSGITSVITHATMTDRLAAMLNYFLKTLTGPDRKSFKVNNLAKYQFKPGDVVAQICQIYLNLGESEKFLSSVSSDGRSYSKDLFSWTEQVLLKINKTYLITGIQEIAAKVSAASNQAAAEEELLTDAPEEFLCPIMSILMLEPVILPSSKQVVDRSTISRHLLSDQNDPFNRSPLTMDQVKTDEELKSRIHAWIADRKQAKQDNQS